MEASTDSPGTGNDANFLGWLARRLAPYSFLCALITLTILLQVAFRVLVPLGYQQIFDGAIAGQDNRLLLEVLIWLGIGWLIHGIAGVAQDFLSASVSSRAMTDLRDRMFRQLQNLSAAYFNRVDSGDVMSRFSNDLSVIEQALARGINTAVFSALNLVISLALLFVVEWRLAAMTMLPLVAAYVGPKLLSPRARDSSYERKASEAETAAAIQESLEAHDMVRGFNLQSYTLGHFRERLHDLAEKTVKAHIWTALVGRTASQIVFFVQILIIGFGGWLAIEGALSVGTLIGFAALLQNVSNASNHLASVTPELLRASGGIRRVQEFLDEDEVDRIDGGAIDIPRLEEDIIFDQVSFGYGGDTPLIHRLSFRLRAGESVALVGSSGSGKSTVLSLLLRLHHPDTGAIRFDSHDLRLASEKSLREQVGIVLQETVLLQASFAENIRLGRLEASQEEIIEAAKLANIHEVIEAKPLGYDTPVGEGGRQISVGQRQRIAIARAILRDPAILVLDEATSALDPASEAAIHQTLTEVGRGRTVIAATHRLGSVVDADQILVLDKGRLVEQGKHEYLLKRQGAYYRLWQKQSGFEISEDGGRAHVTGSRLGQIPWLSKLGDTPRETIAGQFSSKLIQKDRFIFQQGDPGETFYMIAKGRVEILTTTDAGEERQAVLEDGDFFGELALLDTGTRNASARALSPTLLLVLERQEFERLIESQPEVRAAIEDKAANRRF